MENENNTQHTTTATTTEASHEEHREHPGVSTLALPALNLVILLAVLLYYVRKPIQAFVANRHTSLRDEVARVREQLRMAQSQYEEFSAKLRAMDAEIASLRDQNRQEAQATKVRIGQNAQKLSSAIVSDARMSAQGLFTELRGQLYAELGSRVLERAERIIRERLTSDDKNRIRKEFTTHLESVQ